MAQLHQVVISAPPRRRVRAAAVAAVAAVGLLAAVAALVTGGAGRQSTAQRLSQEAHAARANVLHTTRSRLAALAGGARGSSLPRQGRVAALGGRHLQQLLLTQLNLPLSDLELVPVEGTKYDDTVDAEAEGRTGCEGEGYLGPNGEEDRATTGCGHGTTMWVPKGARYPGYVDEGANNEETEALNDSEDPVLGDVEAPSADHEEEVEDIVGTTESGAGADEGEDSDANEEADRAATTPEMDLHAWLMGELDMRSDLF